MASDRPDYYTPKQLAKCWGVDVERINHYTRKGLLTREKMYIRGDGCRCDICWLPVGPDGIDEQVTLLEGFTFSGNNYKLEEVERFEKERPDLIPPKEEYPGLPGEKSINGLRYIAQYLGLSADYLKHCWKEKNCSFNKEGRKLYAYPSQLDKWRASQNRK